MWRKELEELAERKRIAHGLGGEENIARQHAKGKMTVRERIAVLCDPETFLERGILAGAPVYDEADPNELEALVPCPFVMGIGKIAGRRVAVHGDDFTVKGASVGRLYKSKGAYFVKMARSLKLPMVRLIEGAGGSIREILEIGYTELPSSGDECTQNRVAVMSEIPVVSAGFGSVAGLGALYMVQSHFSVMVRNMCHVFVGGPPLVKAAFGEDLTKEALGGYERHTRISGVVDNDAVDERDALDQVKRFLSYMPANVWEMPRRSDTTRDDPNRREAALASIIPRNQRKPYDMRKLLNLVLDRDSIFEIGPFQGRSQITALARLNGYPVGVLANDPCFLGGSFNYDVAEKFQRFVDMCDTFHLPIVNFSDQPGFTIGSQSEIHGTIRKGVRASFALIQATVPVAVIYVRKCFGVAGGAQKSGLRLSWRYAWPSAVWGNIPVEGGVYAAHRREIEAAGDPACLEKLQETYRAVASPFRTAEAFGIEDIIDPRDTRPLLSEWVEMAYPVEQNHLGPKTRGMRC
ncbi:acyl-CoA carboxylase subunit beta [Desulfococcus multivorans]|uniref:Carboxyl transferase n=1 Tax=Desulfococcus multivorans DSM 2059 TaxID=1121405 RepID=S7TZL0_DESML|nr:carboxyl transferase domain-containing protein [Desulfococcus multivorans]AOY60386.1 PccB4: propionyl-CoA carboxylase, subunit beta [Desulfococcus multivorans]AQV02486.1 carboxyl transferase [Desulfococcus multivorans]EPR42170.1 carboxyl transferase [Desulfococcus multivorans DSM 2059]SJZ60315.1 propionyl-CoA carboxylase beta chain [Desulfococcus multivorans DSM 2059]